MRTIQKAKQYIKIWISATLLACFSACNYLDVIPPDQADLDDLLESEESVESYIFGMYASVSRQHWWNGVDVSAAQGGETLNPLEWGSAVLYGTVTSASDLGFWSTRYGYIGRCNIYEELLDTYDPPVGLTEEDMQKYDAELKFLRAYYHFLLMRYYGPIPIIVERPAADTPSDEFIGRYHYDYCTDMLVEMLDEAAEVLPQTLDMYNLGRADATICKAVKSQMLLYAASPLWNGSFYDPSWRNTNFETPGYGYELVSSTYDESKWERALTACQEALQAALDAGYELFDVATANTLATLQKVPLPFVPGMEDEDDEEHVAFRERVRMFQYLTAAHEGNGNKEIIFGAYLPYYNGFETTPYRQHAINRVSVQSNGEWFEAGYNGFAPTLNSAKKFYTKNGLPIDADDSFWDQDVWYTRYYEGTSSPALTTDQMDTEEVKNDIIKFNVGREARYYAWIAFDGGEYHSVLNSTNPVWLNLKNSNTNGYSVGLRNHVGTGFQNKKFIVPDNIATSAGSITGTEYKTQLIRLAELYLNLAECYAALGRDDECLAQLNVVRARAGLDDLTTADLSVMSAMEWVRRERFIEFFCEGGNYYFDIRRWAIAPQELEPGTIYGLNGTVVDPTFEEFNQETLMNFPFKWYDRLYLLPIQNEELYSNPQLVQAPGGY